MQDIFHILFIVFLEFCVYRFIFVCLGHLLTRILAKDKHVFHQRELTISIVLYVLFTFVYFKNIRSILTPDTNAYSEIYILYTLYGVFSVFWAYLHWDAQAWLTLPKFTKQADNIVKKGILYAMVFIFATILGYHQTLSYVGLQEIDPMYSIANISIFTCIIALDRVVNQVYLAHHHKKAQTDED